MFADPLPLHNDVSGASPTTEAYTLISLESNASVRQNMTATAGNPKTLKISHATAGKGAALRNRHLMRMEAYQLTDGVEDPSKPPMAVYVVAEVPLGITADQRTNFFNRFVGAIRGASGDAANSAVRQTFWDRWLAGES